MSRNTGNKPAAPRKNGSPLLTGILFGMVIGVGMAAGLAWSIIKSPRPLVQQEHAAPSPANKPQMVKPQASDRKPAAGNEPHFLQGGSFANADDAEKLKARLALQGLEAHIQTDRKSTRLNS